MVISSNLMSSPQVFVIRRLADIHTKSDQGDASSTPNNVHLDPRSQHIDAELSRACHLVLILVRLPLSVPPYYEVPGPKLFSSSILHHRVGPAQFRVIDVVSIKTLLVDKGSIHVRNMGFKLIACHTKSSRVRALLAFHNSSPPFRKSSHARSGDQASTRHQ
jgi:hypothetical protein